MHTSSTPIRARLICRNVFNTTAISSSGRPTKLCQHSLSQPCSRNPLSRRICRRWWRKSRVCSRRDLSLHDTCCTTSWVGTSGHDCGKLPYIAATFSKVDHGERRSSPGEWIPVKTPSTESTRLFPLCHTRNGALLGTTMLSINTSRS